MGGEGVRWWLSEDRTALTVSGVGPMADWTGEGEAPWHFAAGAVRRLVVEPGVTALGAYAFAGCQMLEEAELPEGLRFIGAKAFSGCSRLRALRLPASLEAVDMKAFRGCGALSDIDYAGSPARWARVRVSLSSKGNGPLLAARLHCRKAGEAEAQPRTDRGATLLTKVRAALKKGGDGRLYVLAPSLYVPDCGTKSGDCTFLLLPQGQTLLIDAGAPACQERVLDMLRGLELTKLDGFLLTHPHIDHVGGALTAVRWLLEERGRSIVVYYSTGFAFKEAEGELLDYLDCRGVCLRTDLRAGDRWTLGETVLEVFNPSQEDFSAEMADDEFVNNISLLLKLTYGRSAYLTGGDLYRGREEGLAARYGARLRADGAKTNHHGLYTSNGPVWLSAVAPRVLLTEGDDVGSSALAEAAAARGAAYYSTGLDGMTLLVLDGDGGWQAYTQYGGEPNG